MADVYGFQVNGTVYQVDYEHLSNLPTVDSVPTEDSENLVTSGGVYAAIDDVVQGMTYVPRFGVSGVGDSSPTLTRLYDAASFTASVSTDTTVGYTDFDSYAPFNRKKCVGTWSVASGESKATFTVNAYYSDADYAEDGSMGDYVAVEVDPFYYYEAGGILAVSTYPYPGYKIHPVCVDADGNIREHTYLPCYALALDSNGKAVSLPGYQNQYGSYLSLNTAAQTYNDSSAAAYAMIEPTAVMHYEWLLQTIEFATQNMQSVMYGAASMRRSNSDVVTYVPAANQIVLGSGGANYVVGQTILIGTYDAAVAVSNFNCITAITTCDASGTQDDAGSYYLITYDGTDRSSSITVGTTCLDTRPWITGACFGYASGVDAILGHTGSPVSTSSGKYPMAYRWRENVYGNQNMTLHDLANVRVADGSDYYLEWYYLPDPRTYTPTNFALSTLTNSANGWVKLGVTTPIAGYVNGFIKELVADTAYPYVKIPYSTTGGSATTYYCDYAYLVNTYEVRAVRHGGYVPNGTNAGPLFFTAYTAPPTAPWNYGAALYMLQ